MSCVKPKFAVRSFPAGFFKKDRRLDWTDVPLLVPVERLFLSRYSVENVPDNESSIKSGRGRITWDVKLPREVGLSKHNDRFFTSLRAKKGNASEA